MNASVHCCSNKINVQHLDLYWASPGSFSLRTFLSCLSIRNVVHYKHLPTSCVFSTFYSFWKVVSKPFSWYAMKKDITREFNFSSDTKFLRIFPWDLFSCHHIGKFFDNSFSVTFHRKGSQSMLVRQKYRNQWCVGAIKMTWTDRSGNDIAVFIY